MSHLPHHKGLFGLVFVAMSMALACGHAFQVPESTVTPVPAAPTAPATRTLATAPGDRPAPIVSEALIQPEDLVYLGAFQLPAGSNGSSWEYSGYALAYFPDGDPDGPDDGFPGSLFGLGHDQQQMVAEINIPVPVIPTDTGPAGLNTANTLQPFTDISHGYFGPLEMPRAGLAYLPAQGDQDTGKLYFAWGQHFQFERAPSHGWSELNLAQAQPAGPWYLDDYSNYVSNDYLCPIPAAWSDQYLPGLRLATGRFRDGLWSGMGPALLALAPWQEGNPPPAGATLQQVTPLLLYGSPDPASSEIIVDDTHRLTTFSEADEWSGVAWLTIGPRAAVIFVGTKAVGESWYGFANGVTYPTSGDPAETVPAVPPWPYDDRGWWSAAIEAQIIFYDPADLGAVAQGRLASWSPQPYATLNITEFLFEDDFDYERGKRYLLGAAAFDATRGQLYIVERRVAAAQERSVIHVFSVH